LLISVHEDITLKTVKVILRMGEGMRGDHGRDESNQGTQNTYTEMLQRNLLYKYYILRKA
jgi:hypothetical protein